jgi:hypothetical protein
MSDMREQLPQVVATGAVAIGAGHALAPTLSGRFWGLDPDAAPVVPHLIRAYGVSLIGLGVVSFATRSEQGLSMRVATGVGLGTALTGVLGAAQHRVGGRSAAMTVVAAGGLAALAAIAARRS